MDARSASVLRSILERSGYCTFHLAFGDGNVQHQKWRHFADRLDEPLHTLVELFLLQRAVDNNRAGELLGKVLSESLIEAGVLQSDGAAVRTTGLVLISFRSLLFFFELVLTPRVYFGMDSIALGLYQRPVPSGTTLDLCSGAGIQAMIAAQQARHTFAIEIDDRASAIARINLMLNQLDKRVTMINMPLEEYAASVTEPFDHIVFNPPQLPAPEGIDYPVGNGGADGLALTNRVLRLYLPHLAENGSIEFIGRGLGRDGNPIFIDELGALFAEHGVAGHAQLIGLSELRPGDRTYEVLVQMVAGTHNLSVERSHEIFENHFRALDKNEMYTFFMRGVKSPRADADDHSRPTVTNLAEVGKEWLA